MRTAVFTVCDIHAEKCHIIVEKTKKKGFICLEIFAIKEIADAVRGLPEQLVHEFMLNICEIKRKKEAYGTSK